jgi:hypothetical protein
MMHNFNHNGLTRRDCLRLAAAGIAMGSSSGWLNTLAAGAASHPVRKRSVILLWMTGGPSQLDTFDMKPDHSIGGEFKPINSSVPGMLISEHLPKLAEMMHHCVPIRSMQTKEGDHSRGTYYMRTGYAPQGPVDYPTMGALISNQLGHDDAKLPNFVSIAPYSNFSPAAYGPGFLGPRRAPLIVGSANQYFATTGSNYEQALRVRNLQPDGVEVPQANKRLDLLTGLDQEFRGKHTGLTVSSHDSAYEQAVRMMRSKAVQAFELDQEDDQLRDAYGRNQFGQGCLLARRLVEQGVPFVEVSLSGVQGNQNFAWDSHRQNFDAVKSLSEVLDPGWATLLNDLNLRGLLDSTLVVWMGEFGRTPRINGSGGRDHFPTAWTTVLCGGGVKGGQFFGATTKDGMRVKDRPVDAPDLMATVCRAIGIDPTEQNMSNVGRPIRLADPDAKPIEDILA